MFAIIGILTVFGAILAGYLMEHGNIRVLLQPAELAVADRHEVDVDVARFFGAGWPLSMTR